ncbi:hypothetical protein JHK85_024730 [Glycine max]|nr:hypothetical protein JHK85_024730 [Glycine max]
MMLNNNKHEKSFSRSKSVSDDLVIFPSLKPSNNDKGLHMFVWSSTSSPTSDVNMKHRVNTVGSADFEIIGSSKFVDFSHETVASKAVAPTIKAEEKTSSSMESTKSFIYTWCSKFEVSKSSSCHVKYRPIHPKLEHLLIMYYSCQEDIDSYTLENLLIMYYSCQVEYRLIYPRKSLLDHIIADSSP